MKNREEQIVEMAKEMRNYGYEHLCAGRVFYYGFCEKLYDAGYRKQSDTVREFVEKVLKIGSKRPLCLFNEYGEGYIDCIENIKKIAKEYGVEVEE